MERNKAIKSQGFPERGRLSSLISPVTGSIGIVAGAVVVETPSKLQAWIAGRWIAGRKQGQLQATGSTVAEHTDWKERE